MDQNSPLVAALRVKCLVPATIVKIGVAAVFALLGCARTLTEVPSSSPHSALFRKSYMRLSYRVRVIVVRLGLRKEEDVLMVGGGSIPNRRWHRVGFVPNNVAAQSPAQFLESKCHAPWHAELFTVYVFVADDEP